MINVTLNGEARQIDDGLTVAQLLDAIGVRAETVVVERNGEFVTRTQFAEQPVEDGDRLELVRIVGGG